MAQNATAWLAVISGSAAGIAGVICLAIPNAVAEPMPTPVPTPVTVTQTENNISLIGSGIAAGERVVTAGWFRLTPGAKVTVSEDKTSSAPATVGVAGAGTR